MAHSPSVTKAVIPAAGLGTRFLPATKATPKEMLPVIDTPAIQYVVEEAAAAGMTDVLMVTGRGKTIIEDHFDRNVELEDVLAAKGDEAGLASIRRPQPTSPRCTTSGRARRSDSATRSSARPTMSATCRSQSCWATTSSTPGRAAAPGCSRSRQHYGGSVVALMEVEPEQVSAYGVATIKPTDEDDVVAVTDLVEKPAVGDAPSNWIVVGRYVCDPAIFDVLRDTPPGRGGEIQLTDALRTLARTDRDEGRRRRRRARRAVPRPPLRHRQQAGLPAHLIQFACERPDIAPEFVPWLRELPGQPQARG